MFLHWTLYDNKIAIDNKIAVDNKIDQLVKMKGNTDTN